MCNSPVKNNAGTGTALNQEEESVNTADNSNFSGEACAYKPPAEEELAQHRANVVATQAVALRTRKRRNLQDFRERQKGKKSKNGDDDDDDTEATREDRLVANIFQANALVDARSAAATQQAYEHNHAIHLERQCAIEESGIILTNQIKGVYGRKMLTDEELGGQIRSVRKARLATPMRPTASVMPVTEPPKNTATSPIVTIDPFETPGPQSLAAPVDNDSASMNPRKLFSELSTNTDECGSDSSNVSTAGSVVTLSPLRPRGDEMYHDRMKRFELGHGRQKQSSKTYQAKSIASMYPNVVTPSMKQGVPPLFSNPRRVVEQEVAANSPPVNDEVVAKPPPVNKEVEGNPPPGNEEVVATLESIPVPPDLSVQAAGFYRLRYRSIMEYYKSVNPEKATHESIVYAINKYSQAELIGRMRKKYGDEHIDKLEKLW